MRVEDCSPKLSLPLPVVLGCLLQPLGERLRHHRDQERSVLRNRVGKCILCRWQEAFLAPVYHTWQENQRGGISLGCTQVSTKDKRVQNLFTWLVWHNTLTCGHRVITIPITAQRKYAGQVVKEHPQLCRKTLRIHGEVSFVLKSTYCTSRKQWVWLLFVLSNISTSQGR